MFNPENISSSAENTSEISQRYLRRLSAEINQETTQDVQSYLRRPEVQESITKFKDSQDLNLTDRKNLIKVAIFYRRKFQLDIQSRGANRRLARNTASAIFASELDENTIVESLENPTKLSQILLPLFGKLRVTTKNPNGRLTLRDANGRKIKMIPNGTIVETNLDADPTIISNSKHLFTAIRLRDGSTGYASSEYLPTAQTSSEYLQSLAGDRETTESMENTMQVYDAIGRITRARSELASLTMNTESSAQEVYGSSYSNPQLDAKISEAKTLLTSIPLRRAQIIDRAKLPDGSISASGVQEMERRLITMVNTMREEFIRVSMRQNLDRQVTSAAERTRQLGEVRDERTSYFQTLESIHKNIDLEEINFDQEQGVLKRIEFQVAVKFITNAEQTLREVEDEVTESGLERESLEYLTSFKTLLENAKNRIEFLERKKIRELDTKIQKAREKNEDGKVSGYERFKTSITRTCELAKNKINEAIRLTTEAISEEQE